MPNLDRITRRLDPKRAKRWQWLTGQTPTQHSPPTRLATRLKSSTAEPPNDPKHFTEAAQNVAPAPAKQATPKPGRIVKAPGRTAKPERKIKASPAAAPAPAAPAKRRGRVSLQEERAALLASMSQPARLIPAAEAAAIKPQGLFEPVDPASLPKPAAPPRSPLAFRSELVATNKQLVPDPPANSRRPSASRVFASFDQVRQDALAHMVPPDPYDQRTQRAEPMRIKPTRRQLAELHLHFAKP